MPPGKLSLKPLPVKAFEWLPPSFGGPWMEEDEGGDRRGQGGRQTRGGRSALGGGLRSSLCYGQGRELLLF